MPISVEGTNGRYGSLDHNFKYDAAKSHESNVEDLLKVYTMKPITNAQMEAIIGEELQQFSMKNVTRTPQERAEALRRQASAQHMIAQDLVNAAKTKHALAASNPEGYAALKRNAVFLSQNDSAFNQRLAEACMKNPAEFARLQYQALEEARQAAGITSPEQLSALYDAPEQELLDRYPTLNRYLRMLAETQALARDEALTPAQREQVQKYHVGMCLTGVLESRMDLMANPLYPDIDPKSLYGCQTNADMIGMHIKQKLPAEDIERNEPAFHPLASYFGSLKGYCDFYTTAILDRAAMIHPGLKNATFNNLNPADELSLGRLVVGHTKNGQDIVVSNRNPLHVQPAKDYTKALYEETVKADKFLLTGSRQFAEMQAAEKELNEAQQDSIDRETTSEKAGKLVEKAQEYLRYKNVEFPYGPEQVANHGKNRREQSRLDAAVKILAYAKAQKAAVDTSIRNEKLLSEVSVNINASRKQRSAFTANMHKLTIVDVADNQLRSPNGRTPSREEFAALVILACGSQQVAGANPQDKYADLVNGVLFEGQAPTPQQTEMVNKAKNLVMDAINTGNAALLSNLVADGLKQNNTLLQKQSALDDRFCFLADLGGKALRMEKTHAGVLQTLPLEASDKRVAIAGKAISDVRAKGLECQRDLAYRLGQDIEGKFDSRDLAPVCQMYGVNKLIAGGQMNLATSPYGQFSNYAEKCNQQLMASKSVQRFITFNDAEVKLPAIQDPKQMTELHDNIIKELHDKALETQQKQQPQLQNELPANTIQQQQPKAATPTMTNG